jgi:Ni,Fe-hydrogenase maturation factor
MTRNTLVVGVGNPTRRDDGAGYAVAERIAALDLPGVEVQTTQQLQLELTEDFARFDRVVVVDASVGGDPVRIRVVHPTAAQDPSGGSGVSGERRHLAEPQSVALGQDAATPDPIPPQGLEETSPVAGESTASHHLSPALLLTLTQRLHDRSPELFLCTVRGEQFDFGDSLSPVVQARVGDAVQQIVAGLRAVDFDETT